jgi:transposase
MAMGKRKRHAKQTSMWVATQDLPRSAAHPFNTRLNQILDKHDFDGYVEGLYQRFYAEEIGRPGLPPGRYFRLLLVDYFEGLDAERAIAWRAADSFAVRDFLGLMLPEAPPDHSTISRTRGLIDVETHKAISASMLRRLSDADLVKGKTIGVDATTLEASAARQRRELPGLPDEAGAGLGHRRSVKQKCCRPGQTACVLLRSGRCARHFLP